MFAIAGNMMKTFPARLDSLYPMLEYVKEKSLANGFSETDFHKIEIAVEEALVNVIHHGYKDRDNGQITINCISSPHQLRIIIEDNGIAHNPLTSKRTPDFKESLENRELGGYGVHFITEIMDEVQYERKGEKNCLTLIKSKNTIPS